MNSSNMGTYIVWSKQKKNWYIVSGEPLWWGLSILPIKKVRRIFRTKPVAYVKVNKDGIVYALGRR